MSRRLRLILAMLVIAGVSFGAGMFVRTLTYHPPSVPCPTEDSCSVDYYGGAWHIVPGRPL